jgi:hypothetical protein
MSAGLVRFAGAGGFARLAGGVAWREAGFGVFAFVGALCTAGGGGGVGWETAAGCGAGVGVGVAGGDVRAAGAGSGATGALVPAAGSAAGAFAEG